MTAPAQRAILLKPLAMALAATLLVAGLFAAAFDLWQRQSLAEWEIRVQRGLSELRAQIETELYGNVHLGARLAAFMDAHPDAGADEFGDFAAALLASGQHAIRYFAHAPEHVIKFVHPRAGNQAQIGRVLLRDSVFSPEVTMLRQSASVRLAGPFEPVPGVRELVVQHPLFGPASGNGASSVVGQVNSSVDLELLTRRAEVYRFAEALDLAIRIPADGFSEAVTLFGRTSIFNARPIVAHIELPGIALDLAAMPHGGWRAVEPVPAFIVPISLLMLLTVFTATYRMGAQRQRLQNSESAMRATGERLATLLSTMPNLVTILDREGRCTAFFGGRGEAHAHIDADRALGASIHDMLPPAKARMLLAASQRALQEDAPQQLEFSIQPDEARGFASPHWPERVQWFRATIAPMRDGASHANATLWITDNITEAREAEIALLQAHNRYRQLTAALQQVVFETDLEGRITFINAAGDKLAGGDASSALGQPWISLLHPEDREILHRAFIELVSGQRRQLQQDVRLAGAGSPPQWVSASLIPLTSDTDSRRHGVLGTLFDINDRKQSEHAMRHQALHDPLTGIPNRLLLIERLEQALARARRQSTQLAVLFVDLDDFKRVNDQYGHLAGDHVLRCAALRLREQVRDTDTVARIGGDEFVVLLEPVTDQAGVTLVANKLVAAMAQPFELVLPGGRSTCRIGASVGIAIAPRDGNTVDALLQKSDSRLYHVKASGKGASNSDV